MCVVSFVGDHYAEKWPKKFPQTFPTFPYDPAPKSGELRIPIFTSTISREEFDALKVDVLEMKELLKKALKYDRDTHQPHCEKPEKIKLLKDVSEAVGVDISDLFGNNT
jgi:hypothetical protein